MHGLIAAAPARAGGRALTAGPPHARRWLLPVLLLGAALSSPGASAAELDGCPAGSYSIVLAPDGATLSILFDQLRLASLDGSAAPSRAVCRISAPLKLPARRSIGVYKVDYRGFARLGPGQEGQLEVQYLLGPHGKHNGRVFKRKLKGAQEGDFLLSETIGAGQMKRVGCGDGAVLNARISLQLSSRAGAPEAQLALDSADGATKGGVVYHLDLKECN